MTFSCTLIFTHIFFFLQLNIYVIVPLFGSNKLHVVKSSERNGPSVCVCV